MNQQFNVVKQLKGLKGLWTTNYETPKVAPQKLYPRGQSFWTTLRDVRFNGITRQWEKKPTIFGKYIKKK